MKQKIRKGKIKERQKPVLKIEKPLVEYLPGLNMYFEKHGFLILLFLLAIISFIIFKDFILFNKIYLYKDIGSDSINATYPHQYQVANYMQQVSFIPKWSFYQGMGQNIFPFSISDPYTLVLMLFGPEKLPYVISYAEIAKIFSAGIFFYFFLKKINISNYSAVAGSLLYSFSGFIILGSCWTIFSTEAVYVAMLLYSFEKFYQDKKIFLFPVTICLIAIHQPFDLFLAGLFLAAYILFRYFSENAFHFKSLTILFLKIFALGLLGVLMSSFFLVPNIIQMLESPRVGGDVSYFSKLMSFPVFGLEKRMHNITAVMRFFSNDMAGTGSNYKGWYNYLEAPLFYCGIVNCLLIPQLFQFLDKRKKIIHSIFLLAFILPVVFPFFRYGYWLFTGDYYRLFSFFIVIIFLLYSISALNFIINKFRINITTLIISFSVILLVLFYQYFPNDEVINADLKSRAAIFLVLYTILIFLLKIKRIQNVMKLSMLLLVSVELIGFSNITVNERPVITGEELKQKTGFNDYSNEAVSYLNSIDKNFFRISKDYSSGPAMHSSINDAQVQNFYGTSSYTSFNQINYIKFLQELDLLRSTDETGTRWARGLTETPFLHPFANNKYALSKNSKSFFRQFNYDSLTTVGDVIILKNRFTLPLGFTYDKFISLKFFKKLSSDQKRITLYKAFVLNDSIYNTVTNFPRFQEGDTSLNYSLQEYADDIALLNKDTLRIEHFSQNLITGKIATEKQKLLFFSIPFDKGWVAKIDGKKVEPLLVNIGFTGLLIDKGEHQVELSFTPRYYYSGALVSLFSIALFLLLYVIMYILRKRKQKTN